MFSGEVVPNNSELEYIQKAAHGDQDAFRHLVLAYETPVLTYLQSMLGDWEDARDLAQETFIAAFYALPRWQLPEALNQQKPVSQEHSQSASSMMDHPLAPWLYRIATNQARDFIRQQSRYKRAGTPLQRVHQTNVSQMYESDSKSQDSSDAWEDRYVVCEMLQEALSQLSDDDAFCIILRFVAAERFAEIADRLGTTKEAVRKRVSRGMVVLRSAYKALDRER